MGNRVARRLRSALTILTVLGLSGLLTLPLASDDRAEKPNYKKTIKAKAAKLAAAKSVTRRTKLSPAGKVGAPPSLAGRLTKQAVTGTVGPGDSISGTLASSGDVAYYTLTLTEERVITIRAESEAFDTFLALHNTSDPATADLLTLLGSDDDGGGGLNSSLTWPLRAGTYLIAVSAAFFGSGPFTLQVSETAVLTAAIGEVASGTFVIDGATGSDFYAIDIASTTTVVIDLTGQEIDAFLGLFRHDGALIGLDDDGGDGLNSRLTVTLYAGTYTIVAGTIGGLGAYELLVTESTTAGGTTVVGSIVPGQTATGILSGGGVEFYALTVATDATLVIDLTSGEFDTFLDLYDTDNPAEVGLANLLALNDDHRLSLNSQITFTLAPGTYLIGVFALSGSGAYELMVSEGAAGGEPAEVISIVPGQAVTGVLSSGGVDFYTLTVTTDATLITDLTSDDFDTFLDIFDTGNPDEAGPTNLLASNDDHGLGRNSQISLNLTAGTYLIGVSAFSGSGVYTLQVEAIPTVVNPISLGVTVTGSLSASGAVDHYVFTLDQSTTVSIDLTSENFDPTLELHATDDPQQASSSTFVAFDDDGGEGLNSRILEVLEAGMYLINVSSFSNAVGDYSLQIFETTVGGAGPTPLTPDFDGDGTVGFSDFLQFALVFGAREGDGRFEARFDLDGSGDIGFTDFLVFAGAFGEPPPSGSPDLTVESPSVDDNTLTTGQLFTLRATVRNQGNASSGSTTLRYYRSSNATVSSNDVEVGTDGVSALSAGGTSAESISLNAPSDAGTYYYGACVDNVSGESNTDNNCSSGVSVTVSDGGGGERACTAGLVVNPDESCNYKNGTFYVNSSGIGIIISGGVVMTAGNNHNQRGIINGVRWNFRATKQSGSNSWTIHTAN